MKKSILMELEEDIYHNLYKERKEGDCEDVFKEHVIRKGLAKHD
jgi:hypothetical protein